ncbi:hypothetical protein [Nocardia testacea]|uniref:Uncharacterized protein n=1 Tax=Nocardia testacea TaxID=248551 RepID=A0ABW7W4R0_9NOCA
MSPQEFNGGFFNHYDDPDEFWDDEPLVVNSRPAPPRPAPTPTPMPPPKPAVIERAGVPSSPAPSSLVEVKCGLDRLPVSIALKPAWKDMFTPAEYGRSIMDAYRHAIREMTLALVESATIPPATIPSLREAAPLLLRTRTDEEYTALYNELFTQPVHTVYGPRCGTRGEPGITVVAKRSQLISTTIDPDWAVRADPRYIAQDIVDCCDQIRGRKPAIAHDDLLDGVPDSEVAARIVEHKRKLTERGV